MLLQMPATSSTIEREIARYLAIEILAIHDGWKIRFPGKAVDARDSGVEIGLEEEGQRNPVSIQAMNDAMRRGAVVAAGQALQHVSDIGHKAVFNLRNRHPIACHRLYFEGSLRRVLIDKSEQTIVGVFPTTGTDIVAAGRGLQRGITDNAKQPEGFIRVRIKKILGKIEAQSDDAHHGG